MNYKNSLFAPEHQQQTEAAATEPYSCHIYHTITSRIFYFLTRRLLSKIVSPAPAAMTVISKQQQWKEASAKRHHQKAATTQPFPCHICHHVHYWFWYDPTTWSLPQIFTQSPVSKVVVYLSCHSFPSVLFNFQTNILS